MKKKTRKLLRTAYHEAGHAVAHFLLNSRISRVSIVPEVDEGSLGHVLPYKKSHRTCTFIENCGAFPDREDSRKVARWHDEVVCILAGMEAVRLFMPGSRFSSGAESDVAKASDILLRLHPEDEAALVYRWLTLRARRLVGHDFACPGIEALAKALIEKREMSGKEARNVIVEANRRRLCDLTTGYGPFTRLFPRMFLNRI